MGKSSDSGDADSGHQLDGEALPGQPNFEEVWRDFSQKLQSGEINKDDAGNLMYEVGDQNGSWWKMLWERYKMHFMISLNLGLLWFSQRMRKDEKKRKQEAGPKILDVDEDSPPVQILDEDEDDIC